MKLLSACLVLMTLVVIGAHSQSTTVADYALFTESYTGIAPVLTKCLQSHPVGTELLRRLQFVQTYNLTQSEILSITTDYNTDYFGTSSCAVFYRVSGERIPANSPQNHLVVTSAASGERQYDTHPILAAFAGIIFFATLIFF